MTDESRNAVTLSLVSGDELVLKVDDVPDCLACDTPGLLLVRYKNAWKNRTGDEVAGIREALLCPKCSRQMPEAVELLALLAVDERVSLQNFEAFGELVAEWINSLRDNRVNEELLRAEHDQWLRGML
ncbi:DUF6300 family protein [Streptomyces microflavus]|uniref:DUF6300 family protein n=1 Tax=Streptomyces microflavus TaxID=1919 RepID=UPI00341676F9